MKTLLIGDNSFIGVSHLAQSRARETASKLNVPLMSNIVEEAVSNGANGFSFSTHPTNQKILQTLQENQRPQTPFDIYPILPYAEGYVRLANEVGMVGIVKHFMADLSFKGKTRTLLSGGISALTLDPIRLLKMYVNVEVERYLRYKPKTGRLASVMLHEVITDLAVSFKAKELILQYYKHIQQKFNVKPGYVTRNFARFVSFLKEEGLPMENIVIMTPFNKVGFQMNPSRELCEAALSSLQHKPTVIAMSILAGGYLSLDDASRYVMRLPNVSGVIVGVSSIQHAQATFRTLKQLAED